MVCYSCAKREDKNVPSKQNTNLTKSSHLLKSGMIEIIDSQLQPTILFQPDKTIQYNENNFFKPCLTNDQTNIIPLENVFDKKETHEKTTTPISIKFCFIV